MSAPTPPTANDARPPLDGRLPAAYQPPTPPAGAPSAAYDPLRWCVMTTVALLAWVVGPPAIVAAMAGLGLVAYVRAVRGGLAESRCVLKRPRLVLAYLAVTCAAGIAGVAATVLR